MASVRNFGLVRRFIVQVRIIRLGYYPYLNLQLERRTRRYGPYEHIFAKDLTQGSRICHPFGVSV